MSVKKAKLKDLIPDDANFNTGTEFGNGLIEKSLSKFGAGRSILLDKNNRIIAGNKTIENAGSIGLDDILVVETDGKQIVAVKRTDVDLNTKKGREMALADNATAKANISWDHEVLAEWDMPVEEWGIESFEQVEEDNRDAEPQIDKAAELNKKWKVKAGDLWQIGEHRLLCGDSTQKTAYTRTVGEAKPNLMVTDPPYGVEYDAEWRNEAFKAGDRAIGKVANDHEDDWTAVWQLFPGNVAYVWHAGLRATVVQASLEIAGFELRAQIVWSKKHFVIGRGHYSTRHEPCWYAVRKGENANWVGEMNEQTVWEFGLDDRAEGGHSTQKPTECMARAIKNHEGDVYEPFAGSGTTLVAAQNLNRKCYAIELSPDYCAVILERMSTAFPELEIKRLEDAKVVNA